MVHMAETRALCDTKKCLLHAWLPKIATTVIEKSPPPQVSFKSIIAIVVSPRVRPTLEEVLRIESGRGSQILHGK